MKKLISIILIGLSFAYPVLATNTYTTDLEAGSSQYWSITDANQTGLEPVNDFTIQFWLKPETLSTQIVLVKGQDGAAITYRALITAARDVDFYLSHATGHYNFSAPGVLSIGTFTHVTLVKRSSGTGMEIYINGVTSATGGGTADSLTNADAVLIGTRRRPAAQLFYDGLVDDFRFWDRVLTPTEIKNNYNCSIQGDEDGLVAYWRFDNDGDDSTTNSNDLTNNNSATFQSGSLPFTDICTSAFKQQTYQY